MPNMTRCTGGGRSCMNNTRQKARIRVQNPANHPTPNLAETRRCRRAAPLTFSDEGAAQYAACRCGALLFDQLAFALDNFRDALKVALFERKLARPIFRARGPEIASELSIPHRLPLPRRSLPLHAFRQLLLSRLPVPFLKGLRRNFSSDQQFRELPTLCLTLEGHLCLISPTNLRLYSSPAAPPPNGGHVLCSQSALYPRSVPCLRFSQTSTPPSSR